VRHISGHSLESREAGCLMGSLAECLSSLFSRGVVVMIIDTTIITIDTIIITIQVLLFILFILFL
jgi:hypothetical protein